MIEFKQEDGKLLLVYDADQNIANNAWVHKALEKDGEVSFKQTFHFKKEHCLSPIVLYSRAPEAIDEATAEDDPVQFLLGYEKDGYYHLDKDVLSIDFDLYIHKDIKLAQKSFVSEKRTSIFIQINKLSPDEIYIGGEHPGNLPEDEFKRIIKSIPNYAELKKYVIARISSVLRESIDTKIDGEVKYNKYMNKNIVLKKSDLPSTFNESEINKYTYLLSKLETMLDSENSYSEANWQEEISQFILLLYPKYIRVFKEVPVRDTYNGKDRSIDLLLVDSSGNIDIIEIKKPFDNCIITKNQYRGNYIPLRELSGTVMQLEKYLFYLNKSGKAGEEKLTKKYKDKLPDGFSIKITSPGGIIIMGRDLNLSDEQKQDYEIIKRKYKNVIDIMTYDDLLLRLKVTINSLSKQAK